MLFLEKISPPPAPLSLRENLMFTSRFAALIFNLLRPISFYFIRDDAKLRFPICSTEYQPTCQYSDQLSTPCRLQKFWQKYPAKIQPKYSAKIFSKKYPAKIQPIYSAKIFRPAFYALSAAKRAEGLTGEFEGSLRSTTQQKMSSEN